MVSNKMKKPVVCLLLFCVHSVLCDHLRAKRGIIRDKIAEIKDKSEDRKDQAAEDAVNKLMGVLGVNEPKASTTVCVSLCFSQILIEF